MILAKKGFTLLELLIVVAIIGIISTIVTVSVNSSNMRSRAAAFKSEIASVQKAFVVVCDQREIDLIDIPAVTTFDPITAVPRPMNGGSQDCGPGRSGSFTVSVVPTNGASCASATINQTGATFNGC